LIHLIDGTAPDPLLDFAQINSELALFDPNLAEKPQIVAFNKMDMPDAEAAWPQIQKEIEERGYQVFPISALAGTGIRPILFRALELLEEFPAEIETPEIDEMPIYRPESDPRAFEIEIAEDGWHVTGVSIERAAAMTYWEYSQSRRRFQRILQALGIEDALTEAGVSVGDTVFIGEYELEWQE
jgi:GTP-binding protein